jgi:hypothetical protein
MDNETQGQNGDHDGDDGRGHEVAAQLEPAVSVAVREGISRYFTEVPFKGIDDGEEVNGTVQEQENDEECARYALDEFLADRGG